MKLSIEDIMAILPHRYPMLLVDRVDELEPLKSAVGVKNVTMNEPFFVGHFPNRPVMPGVFLCESMAQLAAIAILYPEENRGLIPMFTGMDKVRFRAPVVPGDTVRLEATILKVRGKMGKGFCQSSVDGEVRAEAEFMFFLSETEKNGEKS